MPKAIQVPPLDGFLQPVNISAVAQNFDGVIGGNADLFWSLPIHLTAVVAISEAKTVLVGGAGCFFPGESSEAG